ncbi:MAG: cytochrome c-type biogenesis protein CcmH [Gammaproteobacteria bacterium]|nr:cytochrome c-type biogenesis protein CcmH [Gammaproteobacteria bacterium]
MIRNNLLLKAIALGLFIFSYSAQAGIEAHTFEDSQKEGLYKELIEELRCLVCQNQNLAGSNAELALDLRQQTYDMVQSGSSKSDVVDYMVQRYGDFVLYRPPFNLSTLLLWVGPFVILLIAVLGLLRYIRGRDKKTDPEITPEDMARAERLLSKDQQD